MTDATAAANIELVLRHYDEFLNNGDMSAAERDLRPDFVDHAAPPGTPPGLESSKAFITMVRSAFPDIQFTEDEVIANGDMVAVSGLWQGTHEGPFFGLEPTGRFGEMRGMVLWRVVQGQLAERWAVLDYDALFGALQDDRQPSSLASAGR
jgi:predicted ester cyclase